jgi:hypothetical protein
MLSVLLAAAAGDDARAQAAGAPDGQRSGLWLDVGLGAGPLTANLSGTAAHALETELGVAGSLAFGGTLNPAVRFGFGAYGWVRSRASLHSVMLLMRLYPTPEKELWILLGGGYYGYSQDREEATYGLTGAAGAVGIGYGIRLGDSGFIVPHATFLFGLPTALHVDEVKSHLNGSLYTFQIGAMLEVN